MAIAFIQITEHPAAYKFYKDFAPKEPVGPSGALHLKAFHKISVKTAHELLKVIAAKAKKQSEILIVTHGNDQGLYLPLTRDNDVQLERTPIEIYLDPGLSRAEKRTRLKVDDDQLQALDRARAKVLALDLKRVEFRACFVGADVKVLEALRDFFGADIAGGPDLQDAYTPCPKPFTGATNSWWTNHSTAQIETMSGGKRVGYDLQNVTAVSFGFQWAVDDTAAQKEWVGRKFPAGKKVAQPAAIHGILDGTTKLIFPGESTYRAHLHST